MSNQPGSAFWNCPQCGGMGSVLDSRCPQCGTVRPINPTTTVAPTTSMVVPPTIHLPTITSFSSIAGQSVQNTQPPVTTFVQPQSFAGGGKPRSRMIAAMLGIFLGFFGAQYFYMGRRPLGFLSLALCWTGFPATVGLMEGLRMLVIDDNQFARECVG